MAVEKLASKKSAKIKTRREAQETVFSSRLDIFSLSIFGYFEKKGLFQQPLLLSPSIGSPCENQDPHLTNRASGQGGRCPW